MSPTLVYFLMMADSIKNLFGWLAVAVFVICLIFWFARAVVFNMDDDNVPKTLLTSSRRLPWVFVVFASLATFIPGTKTVAAMVVLPKLTSPQALDAMGSEAKQLYDLAKDALKHLVDGDTPDEKK